MHRHGVAQLLLVGISCQATQVTAFVNLQPAPTTSFFTTTASATFATSLHLVPIASFRDDFAFLSTTSDDDRCCIDQEGRFQARNNDIYDLCLIEEQDLPDLSRFIVQAFGADAIRLSTDINYLERMLMKPAVELLNGYSGIVAFAEVLAGLRSRIQSQLILPKLDGLSRSEKLDAATSTSVVLAVAKQSSGSDQHVDIIGSVEVRLQPCDAKIPFSLPWLDKIERWLAALIGIDRNTARDLQPYLSNLCVDESFRGQRIGRALVRSVENIACTTWGFSRMYLHVDVDNKAALELYKSEGYRDVGLRWKPFWAGKAADIGYFVKNLQRRVNSREESKMDTAVKETKSL